MKALIPLPINLLLLLMLVATLLPAKVGHTQGYQYLVSIEEAARNFILSQTGMDQDNVEITIGSLDSRLRLSHCDKPLEAFFPTGSGSLSGNTSIGIRCDDANPWKLYIPAKINVYENVLTAKRYLKRGTQLTEGDLVLQRTDITTLTRGYATEPQQVIGLILKQPLAANAAIVPALLEAQMLIRRGEGVIILAINDGVEVRMKGKALKDGSTGQIIQVQNLTSQRVVEGQVISRGVVSVAM